MAMTASALIVPASSTRMKHPPTWRHTQPSEDGRACCSAPMLAEVVLRGGSYASAEETVSEMIKRRKELQKAFAAGDVMKLVDARRRVEGHERGHTRGGPRGSLPTARTEQQRIAAVRA
ncbi:hypothetical protein PHYSODRAFT_253513 [Phytophthora sojae]|uniref:Uncharacterized protein n=1 Tax=Phytophthora sojae (strain P6497) TaxID=1094619 RepID=G4YSD1_PHYSP|nr:hypothetical protein PHYSODRAFT_253513 [Phytophthora sojae]EGZ25362.1 hypothetical protein PHYSODRAFT_253513 [Phytophthora sojae]|eukprot:XP_009520650.1 hypothetical protein PHYSODRAFT_253513 [Phytophthora sojae]